MNISNRSSFYYNANAVALGGYLTEPFERVLSTHASASLSQAGGVTAARSDLFHVDGLISIGAGNVHVSGTEHPDDEVSGPNASDKEDVADTSSNSASSRMWRSRATAIVEQLNVLDVVTADRLVAQICVTHREGHSSAQVALVGTKFDNLKINGIPALPEIDQRLFGMGREDDEKRVPSAPTVDELIEIAKAQYGEKTGERNGFVDKLGKRFAQTDPTTDLEQKGSTLCTLVRSVTVPDPAQSYGHVIHVPDFGNIFLGELLVNRFGVQFAMVRIEMGCIAAGTVSACHVKGNGRPSP